MNVSSRAALLLCALTLVLRAPVGAAQTTNTLIPTTPVAPVTLPDVERPRVGPTADALAVGVRPVIVASPTAPSARGSAGLGQSEAMMIVGGAAILVGAIVGGNAGDVFMIGGAVVGLYGLYKYLQ
ncbi:MAG TPA: hypothetical protein VGJ18_09595 [Gemmatimonadaceae bacterium]|jgi:hypothetical protein